MRYAAEKLRFFHRNSSLNFFSVPSAPRILKSYTTTTISASLTEEEVNQINALIPRLCDSNHLKEAVSLLSTALATSNPPLASLPLSPLIDRLASEPDLTHHMRLLNSLKFHPNASNPAILIPAVKMFLSSFFDKGQPKRAFKIFQWLARPDFPGGAAADLDIYAGLVDGFCMNGMVLESLRVLREMVSENLAIGYGIRVCVYRSLLREARVREALELNAALCRCTPGNNGGTFSREEMIKLLDQMIATWME